MTLLKRLAFGTGAGVEVDGTLLRAAVVRLRAGEAEVLASGVFESVAELAAFLRAQRAAERPLLLILPATECITRAVSMPGVRAKDRQSALDLQREALSPYGESEEIVGWQPVAGTDSVLTGIARLSAVNRWAEQFAEAGLRLDGCTVAPAVVPRSDGPVLAIDEENGRCKIYGQGPGAALLWAELDMPAERALTLTRSQMRLDRGD